MMLITNAPLSLSRKFVRAVYIAGFGALLFTIGGLVGSPGHAAAVTVSIPSTVAPSYIRNDINYRCNTSHWNVVQDQWISPAGSPGATSMTVPYNTTSVALQLNWISFRCKSTSPSTLSGHFYVTGTSPYIGPLYHYVGSISYVGTSSTGYRSGVSRAFTYSQTFLSSTTVSLTMNSQGTVTKSNGNYCAVVLSEPQVTTPGPLNFNPQPGYCKVASSVFTIRVNVTAPAQLDGWKVDDQGYDAVSRPAGGNTNPAYNTLPVSVAGVGTQSPNPFYFTTAAGGGNAIPVATSGSQIRTVSINTSALPATYDLVGYAICYTGQSGCSNANLEFGNASFYHSLGSASSFNWTFVSGRNYHMRWIFRFISPVNCGSFSINPTSLDPYTKFQITTTVRYSSAYVPINPRMTLSFAESIAFNGNPSTVGASVSGLIATSVFGTNAAQLGPTTKTGVFHAQWTYTDDGRVAAGLPPIPCPGGSSTAQFNVANKPYLHVYGGDVMAGTTAVGTTAANDQACQKNGDAGVYSWNNRNGTYSGAGAQYAVMALDQIMDFASASGTASQPLGLSFANTGLPAAQVNTANGMFGGTFGGTSIDCNFTAGDVNPTQSTTDQIINSSPVETTLGAQDIRYVDGANVFINGNIVYVGYGGAWTQTADIPYFKLVVTGGNIYIGSNVTQLDGVYVAEQDADGNGGTIFTCATNLGAAVDPTSAAFYSTCNNKLTVNGVFAAQQIQFLRTFGTVGRSPTDTRALNNAAEVFNYSPEVWLPRSNAITLGGKYDAITGLPPVL